MDSLLSPNSKQNTVRKKKTELLHFCPLHIFTQHGRIPSVFPHMQEVKYCLVIILHNRSQCTNVLPDDEPIRSKTCMSLMFLKYCKPIDNYVHLLVKL